VCDFAGPVCQATLFVLALSKLDAAREKETRLWQSPAKIAARSQTPRQNSQEFLIFSGWLGCFRAGRLQAERAWFALAKVAGESETESRAKPRTLGGASVPARKYPRQDPLSNSASKSAAKYQDHLWP